MTVTFPDGIDAQGNASLWFVPTIANLEAPEVTEINAGVNISCVIDGFSPGVDQSTYTDVRYCSTQTFEQPGRTTTTIEAINYVYDPQTPADATNYKAYSTLKQGTRGFLVNRLGVSYEDPIAVGDVVDIYPVVAGAQARQAVDPSAEGSKLKVTQGFFVVGETHYDVVVDAA